MPLFRNAIFAAAIAGLLAGLVLAALQTYATVPLILQAEAFESAAELSHHHGVVAAESHDHGGEAWSPDDGFERLAYTLAFNIVSGVGFALLLLAASEFAGGIADWRRGVLWGFAGFAVFILAPGLGLPPELPAMPAADLLARRAWWIGTVVATAAGLALIAFRGTAPLSILGVALIVLPHIIGAPQPQSHESPIPETLHHRFVVSVAVTNLVFWVALGGILGLLRHRFLGRPENPGKSLA